MIMYLQLLELFFLQVNLVDKSSHWLLGGLLRWLFLDVHHAQFWLLCGTWSIQRACRPLIVDVLVELRLLVCEFL